MKQLLDFFAKLFGGKSAPEDPKDDEDLDLPIMTVKATDALAEQEEEDLNVQFVAAKNFGPARKQPIMAIVIHTMEAPEGPRTAENTQYYEDRNTALAVKKVLKRDTAVTNLRIGRGMGS